MLITKLNEYGNIKKGCIGKRVKLIQELLVQSGYKLPQYGIDSKFGYETAEAVRKFQKDHGLKVDAIVGDETLYELLWYKYPHFNKEEFKCKCGGKYCNGYPKQVDEKLLILLEKIRKKCGNKAINITSGLRCKQHNANTKNSSSRSQHLYGTAADIKAIGVPISLLRKVCLKLNPKGGVGTSYNTIVHVDARGYKARW